MMSFICSCRNKKIGAKLHIYLEEGTYHKRLFTGHVVKSRSHGVILEVETRLESTSEELVRDRLTGDGRKNAKQVQLAELSGSFVTPEQGKQWRNRQEIEAGLQR